MGANRIDLAPIRSTDVQTLVFSFTSQLASGEAITSLAPSVVVYTGPEVNPLLTIASPSFSATTVSIQVASGTPNVIYELTIRALTNQSNQYVQRALLAILPNPE